jgi:hypothetical protein
VRDEAGALEDAEMLGDRGPADRQPGCQVADGSWPAAEEFEHLPPRGVAECVQRMTVSDHLP